ncbi:hypothetical protein ACIRF8_35190 [Streptomyces sp. NPDC102406]|uniref:hypothetical protein n=1 Tax=Streptomyces sp. NPDC102406 TaxID=3366171 RepID=UPI00382CCB4E
MTANRKQGKGSSVWYRSLYSRWMLAVGVVTAIALLVIAVVSPPHLVLCLWLLLAAAAFLATGAVKVAASPQEVTVASALMPFLRRRIPLSRIDRASARWTRPLEIGGWGYRWKPGVQAVSLREGDALWLDLTNGTRFVITIDDAQTAADLINSHLPQPRTGD